MLFGKELGSWEKGVLGMASVRERGWGSSEAVEMEAWPAEVGREVRGDERSQPQVPS